MRREARIEHRLLDIMALQEGKPRQRQHIVAHLALEMGAADVGMAPSPLSARSFQPPDWVPQEIAGQVAGQRAFGGQLVHHLRKIIGQDPVARRQQAVGVLALRHALAVPGRSRLGLVAFDQRDALEMVGERARRAEPRHAAAENDRVPSCLAAMMRRASSAGVYAGRASPDRALARS